MPPCARYPSQRALLHARFQAAATPAAHPPSDCAAAARRAGQRARQAGAARQGACLHREPPQERDALHVRQGEGTDETARQPRGPLSQGAFRPPAPSRQPTGRAARRSQPVAPP
eukprot:scaffold29504_cov23-Tisochrysis_lutea.AAC.3